MKLYRIIGKNGEWIKGWSESISDIIDYQECCDTPNQIEEIEVNIDYDKVIVWPDEED